MSTKTIFKKIIDGEILCHKIYEDEHFFAFLDLHPKAPGHTLVIPKEKFTWVWDVTQYNEYWDCARRLSFALRKAFSVDLIHAGVHGDEIPHAHIHLWPELEKDGTETDFKYISEKIKNHL